MTPEEWLEVERLYYATLDRNADERAAFLADACGANDSLRREVESLIAYQTKAADFIERPAIQGHLASALSRLEESSIPGRFVGRRFGAYDVKELIAAGGMGEVYRAVDTRLNRTVAIKTLSDRLSNDPERRARFEGEARIVSSLTHPHICTLHEFGTEGTIQYLVMEHIEGETLQARLERGPVPLVRALEYAIQIVDALDKAHRRGVVHRDLKPGNVMLTKSGMKLLDFGLAMRSEPAAGIAFDTPLAPGSHGLTARGAIMGTPRYLAPEQLEGRPADVRTDIFAFGVLAYEMITGQPAFPATNQAQLVGQILKDDPVSIVERIPDVPPRLAQTLSRCLAKDPDERWQTANDLLFELRSIAGSLAAIDPLASPAQRRSRWIERAAWIAIVVASALVALLWVRGRIDRSGVDRSDGRVSRAALVRYSLFPAEGTTFHSGSESSFALSPDGRHIAYVASTEDGTKQLWLHSLDVGGQQPISGTEGASSPFWSPDSEWLGFTAGHALKKVRVSSGLVQPIANNVSAPGGATWNADDVIVFGAGPGGLSRVSARGGPVSRLTRAEQGSHFWPQFLGDGVHFIYAAAIPGRICLGSLANEAPRTLMDFSVRISSLAYVPGYILFVQDATLFARPFDETRFAFSGKAVRLVDGIPIVGPGRAPFSVSATGVLAYWTYPPGTPAVLRWLERDGRASTIVPAPAQYLGFSLSPDARQIVFSRAARNGGADVWLRDLTRGSDTRLTFDGAAFTPQWSPDGSRVVFSGPAESPPPKLFVRNVATGDAATRIGGVLKMPNFASGWSGDSRSIVSVRIDPQTGNDLWVQRLQDGTAERLPFNTPFNDSHGKVSPDNRLIAYQTDESGRDEVWVASFPSGAIRRQVSVGGGSSPEWGENSQELLYLSDDKRLLATRVTAALTTIDVSAPHVLFQIKNLIEVDRIVFPTSNAYVAASNGQRFLVAEAARDPAAPPITVLVNWTALLNR